MSDYTFNSQLVKLNEKIDNTKTSLQEDLSRVKSVTTSAITTIRVNMRKELSDYLSKLDEKLSSFDNLTVGVDSKFEEICKSFENRFNRFNLTVREHLDAQDQQNIVRDEILQTAISQLRNSVAKMHFNLIDNANNVTLTYTNLDGNKEYASIKKYLPDNKTIGVTKNNEFYLKYSFNPKVFNIDKDVITVHSLDLGNGRYLSCERVANDLSNVTYTVGSLNYKLENVLKQLNTINGYIASNNFRRDIPTQEQLSEFAITCLSTEGKEISKDVIPSGTKIKNTYNNHIWVLNRISIDGLTTIKWEDFGSDNICIASNDGVHGLVSGSQEKFRGYIDINGVISINGLEEEFTSIIESMLKLTNDLQEQKLQLEDQIYELKQKIDSLEK